MNPSPAVTHTSARRRTVKAILLEAACVAACGTVFAFLANWISPRGLALSKNYFPGSMPRTAAPIHSEHAPDTNGPATAIAPILARLHAKGLQAVDFNRVKELLVDPRFQQGMVIFVDARNDEHYQSGHIPGAYQFDHFRADKYISHILPACQAAEQIVVYCTGGDCEDSESAALTLREMGIPSEKLFIYAGGIHEWTARKESVELMSRDSGQIKASP